MKRAGSITVIIASIALYMGAALQPATAQVAALKDNIKDAASVVRMTGAVADVGGKPEVRLRWSVTEGWLPAGGFNIYRIEAGNRTKLNSSPIGGQAIGDSETLTMPGGTKLELGKWMRKAKTIPAGTKLSDLKVFGNPSPRPASSAPAFNALRSQIKTLQGAKGPALTMDALRARVVESPAMSGYLKQIAGGGADPSKRITDLDQVVQIRSELLSTAMMNKDLANKLGLAYNDSTANDGASYTYALRTIDEDGRESSEDAVTFNITVGSERIPPTPEGIEALQFDETTVDLRWTRLGAAEETALGVATYNITRIDPKHPNGIKLNDLPVIIQDMPREMKEDAGANNSDLVEPITFFRDTKAPVGNLTYKLTLVDMFGRESATASYNFAMEDWSTPPSVTHAQAEKHSDGVKIAWPSLPEDGVMYKVYRTDTENWLKIEPALLTPQPIAGDVLDLSSISKSKLIDVLTQIMQTYDFEGRFKVRTIPKDVLAKMTDEQKALAIAEAQKISSWLVFTDKTAQPDHFYEYIVTAIYTKNNRESVPAKTGTVAIPNLNKPASPSGLSSSFVKAGEVKDKPKTVAVANQLPNTSLSNSNAGKLTGQQTVEFQPYHEANWGGTVTLTWKGETNVSYRVYRANATVFKTLQKVTSAAPVKKNSSRSFRNGKLSGLMLGVAGVPKVNQPAVDIPGSDIDKPDTGNVDKPGFDNNAFSNATDRLGVYVKEETNIPDSEYVLLATAKGGTDAKYVEDVPRSNAHYYRYRIVPVNRWGVDGDKVELSVRVPATMAPTVPQVFRVYPDNSGNVVVKVVANQPDDEVAAYHVYRKTLKPKATAPVSPQPNSAAKPKGPSIVGLDDTPLLAIGPVADKLGDGASRFGVLRSDSAAVGLGRLSGDKMSNALALAKDFKDPGEDIGQIPQNSVDVQGIITFVDNSADPHYTHLYRVVAENSDKIMSEASQVLDAMPKKIKADAVSKVSLSYDGNAVKMSWDAAPDAVGYTIERAVSPDTTFLQITGIVQKTAYDDVGAFPGNTYVYRVRALDSKGNISDPTEATIQVKEAPADALDIPNDPAETPADEKPIEEKPKETVPASAEDNKDNGSKDADTKPVLDGDKGSSGDSSGKVGGTAVEKPISDGGEALAPSNDAAFGSRYKMCKEEPIEITVKSAEFTVTRVQVGEHYYFPTANEKLLVVHFTLRNPNKKERYVDWATLAFTAVDSTTTNREGEHVGIDPNKEALGISLKSEQEIDAYTVIRIPAKADVDKLLVKCSDDEKTLGYVMNGRIKSVESFVSESEINIEAGKYYPMGLLDYKMLDSKYTSSPILNEKPGEEKRYLVITIGLRNPTRSNVDYDYSSFAVLLRMSDGKNLDWNQYLLSTASNDQLSGTLTRNQEIKARLYFEVPKGGDVAARSLRFGEGESRVYIYKLP